MGDQSQVAARVSARRERLRQELASSARLATMKVARGDVYLLMGKYATEEDLKQRLNRLSRALKAFS